MESSVKYKVIIPPNEIITLSDVKKHLKLNIYANSSDNDISLESNSYVVNTYNGVSVDVLNKTSTVNINCGDFTGEGNFKIQDSNDDINFFDYYSFTEIDLNNDNQIHPYDYQGLKQFIRVVAVITTDICKFTANVYSYIQDDEDDLLNEYITTSREFMQDLTNYGIGEQTIDMYLEEFPKDDDGAIWWVFNPLISITSFKYKDIENVEYELFENTDFYVDLVDGKLYLAPYECYPTNKLWNNKAITIRGVCGYDSDDVPKQFKQSMLLYISFLYKYRDSEIPVKELFTIFRMCTDRKKWF